MCLLAMAAWGSALTADKKKSAAAATVVSLKVCIIIISFFFFFKDRIIDFSGYLLN